MKQPTDKIQEKLQTSHKNLANELKISVNINDVLDHLDFLKKIDDNGQDTFYNENFVLNSIRRYELFWIPFILKVSSNFDEDLQYSPPLGMNIFLFLKLHKYLFSVYILPRCILYIKIVFQMFIGFGMFIC